MGSGTEQVPRIRCPTPGAWGVGRRNAAVADALRCTPVTRSDARLAVERAPPRILLDSVVVVQLAQADLVHEVDGLEDAEDILLPDVGWRIRFDVDEAVKPKVVRAAQSRDPLGIRGGSRFIPRPEVLVDGDKGDAELVVVRQLQRLLWDDPFGQRMHGNVIGVDETHELKRQCDDLWMLVHEGVGRKREVHIARLVAQPRQFLLRQLQRIGDQSRPAPFLVGGHLPEPLHHEEGIARKAAAMRAANHMRRRIGASAADAGTIEQRLASDRVHDHMVLLAMLWTIVATNPPLVEDALSSWGPSFWRRVRQESHVVPALAPIEKARRASCGPGGKTSDYCQCLLLPFAAFTYLSWMWTCCAVYVVPDRTTWTWTVCPTLMAAMFVLPAPTCSTFVSALRTMSLAKPSTCSTVAVTTVTLPRACWSLLTAACSLLGFVCSFTCSCFACSAVSCTMMTLARMLVSTCFVPCTVA